MNKKVCVVGAGDWGKNHIATLDSLDSLSAIVDFDQKTISRFQKLYPKINCHESVEEALKNNYDGYVISTPADTHFSIAKKIILSGKHVLIEKPMTLSVEESEEIVFIAKEKKINVLVGHVLLFHPAIKKIKKLIKNGRIGELQYLYSNRLNLGKVRNQENVFWSLAPHDIAIFQYLTGSHPKKIHSIGSSFLQEGVHDSTIMQMKYKNGVEAHIFVSWLHPFKEHRLVIIGSESMITFEDSVEGNPLKLYSKKFDLAGEFPEKIDGPVELVPYDSKKPLTLELEYFLDHLDGKKITLSNANDGLEVVKILVESGNQLLR